MADERMRVGDVEILELSDAAGPMPVPLSRLFPGVSAAQWAPYRQLYPAFFAGEDTAQNNIGCFLLRSRGRTLLVDTGIGPGASGCWSGPRRRT